MAKKKKKNQKKPVIVLRKEDLESVFFKELSPTAFKVYIALCWKHNGCNNGKIKLTYTEVARELKGVGSPHTLKKALNELEKQKLIRKTKKGGLFNRATTYELREERVKVF